MELRFVVPNMEKTFGNLEFAGENTTEQQRINGRMAVITRSYNLYSDVQRADDVVVTLPAKAGEKHFSPEQKVKLINPRITTDGYKIGERGFVNYISPIISMRSSRAESWATKHHEPLPTNPLSNWKEALSVSSAG